jgi:hypothetical protein
MNPFFRDGLLDIMINRILNRPTTSAWAIRRITIAARNVKLNRIQGNPARCKPYLSEQVSRYD